MVQMFSPLGLLRLPFSRLVWVVLWVVVMVAVSASPASAGEAPGDVAGTVDRYAEGVVGDEIPGVSAAVLHRGETVHTTAAGTAGDGKRMATVTPMRVHSLSKSFTATAIMQLVEAGDVDLDDPARDYLPEFSIDDPRGEDITVRHLLTQSSGITDASTPDLVHADVATLKEAVARLDEATLAADPGTRHDYSNPNYHVLARMVEVVSGEEFADYLERHILSPLGMDATQSVDTAEESVPGVAQGHVSAFGRPFPSAGPDYFVGGSGGIVSTAEDMALWVAAHANDGVGQNGQRILSARSIQQMHEPDKGDYGFGWYHADSAEGPPERTSHSGSGSGSSAYQGIFPDSDYAVVVLTNHGPVLTVADASILSQNLLAQVDDDVPSLSAPEGTMGTDLVLTVPVLLSLAAGVTGLMRCRRWAERRCGRSVTITLLRLVPLVLGISLFWAVPQLQLIATGRVATWPMLVSVMPVAAVWLLILAAGSAAVLAARLIWLGVHAYRTGSSRSTG